MGARRGGGTSIRYQNKSSLCMKNVTLFTTGFLGKSLTRHFNRLWNYFVKGAMGSTLLVLCFPVMCVVASTLSLVTAVTSPIW